MKKWSVYAVVDAGFHVGYVEAETGEEAAGKAYEKDECCAPTLCNYCSRDIELGDLMYLICDSEGEEFEDSVHFELRKENDDLKAKIKDLEAKFEEDFYHAQEEYSK